MKTISKILSGFVLAAAVFGTVFTASFAEESKSEVRAKNEETGYVVVIADEADLLSDVQEQAILDVMKPLTKYGNIALLTTNENHTSAKYYAEAQCHNRFGRMSSQSAFLIDMDNREIFVYSDGDNYKTLTDQKGTIITDNVYTYASANNYYMCAYKAFEQMYKLLDGGRIMEPMRYITSALISILVAMMVCFIIINSYSKLKTPSLADVLGPVQKVCNVGQPAVTLTKETKTYSPQSSGSSGGHSGGGGHHSSGGSHHSGGGGGHRF